MNPEPRQPEDFIALVGARSFSQAAEKRFVTQPAFSRCIRSLEDTLSPTLVNHQRMPVELTEAGQLFLIIMHSVVEQLGQMVRHLHHLKDGRGEVLQFAAAHSLALGFFPQWIARLRNEGLSVTSRLIATNVDEAVHSLCESSCDLILAFCDPDATLQMGPEISPSLHLGHTEILPVCAVNAEDLLLFGLENGQSVPLLAYSASAFLGRGVNLLLRQCNLRYTTIYEAAMADSLKSMTLQGMGVAWVPWLSVVDELERDELAICGGPQWFVPQEIRLYHCALVCEAAIRLFQRKLENGPGNVE